MSETLLLNDSVSLSFCSLLLVDIHLSHEGSQGIRCTFKRQMNCVCVLDTLAHKFIHDQFWILQGSFVWLPNSSAYFRSDALDSKSSSPRGHFKNILKKKLHLWPKTSEPLKLVQG